MTLPLRNTIQDWLAYAGFDVLSVDGRLTSVKISEVGVAFDILTSETTGEQRLDNRYGRWVDCYMDDRDVDVLGGVFRKHDAEYAATPVIYVAMPRHETLGIMFARLDGASYVLLGIETDILDLEVGSVLSIENLFDRHTGEVMTGFARWASGGDEIDLEEYGVVYSEESMNASRKWMRDGE